MNHQTIGYLERGDCNPSLELALRIAEHFGLPIETTGGTPLVPEQLYQTRSSGDDH